MVIQKYNLNETPSKKEEKIKAVPIMASNPKPKKRNLKWLIYLWLVVGVLAVFSYALKLANEWWEVNRFEFHKLIQVKIQKPITIEQRQPITIVSPLADVIDEPVVFKDLTETEQMILDTFGLENYKIARAIAKAESGMRCDAFNINTNNTIDYGLYQINSIHWKRFGGLEKLVTCEQQIKAAYELYKEQGWNPWVVYNTGRFIGEL
jgi:hypothetical protein